MSHFNLTGQRWNQTTVTWSIATQNFGGQPGGAFSNSISDQIIINDITNSFAQWDAASGLSFQMVPDAADVDIRFGYGQIDNQVGGTIGLANWTFDGQGFTTAATVRFDIVENYFTQGGEVYVNNTNNPITSVALHEIGHTLGLDHYNGEPAVMNSASGTNIVLQSSDIHGVQFLYGVGGGGPPPPPPPPNDDFAGDTSTTGQVSVGGSATGNLEAGGDRDWFRVQLTAGVAYTIDLQGAATGTGTLNDPFLRLYDGAGGFLDQDDDSGDGLNSRLAFTPGTTGTYFVSAGDFGDNDPGTYRVSVAGTAPPPSNPAVAQIDDVLWRHTDGSVSTAQRILGQVASNSWQIAGIGDFDRDGDGDILWRHDQGPNVVWDMENGLFIGTHGLPSVTNSWRVAGTADFDEDGDADILFRHAQGANTIWEMQSGNYVGNRNLPEVTNSWQVAGTGDFDDDGDADILFRHFQGANTIWAMENGNYVVNRNLPEVTNSWQVAGTGDFDDDGDADILFRHFQGASTIWELENGQYVGNHNLPDASNSWQVQGVWDFDSDGDGDILLRHDTGVVVYWEVENTNFVASHSFGAFSNAWQIRATGDLV
jgi:hypothetical protein